MQKDCWAGMRWDFFGRMLTEIHDLPPLVVVVPKEANVLFPVLTFEMVHVEGFALAKRQVVTSLQSQRMSHLTGGFVGHIICCLLSAGNPTWNVFHRCLGRISVYTSPQR